MLLPKIKRRVKLRRETAPDFRGVGGGNAVELRDFLEGRLVKDTPHQPTLVPVTPKIAFAEVFDPDEALCRIVEIDLGHADTLRGEEFRDLDVALILGLCSRVFNQNDRLLARELNAIKFAVGSTFLDRIDLDCRFLEARETDAGLLEKRLGKDHHLEIAGGTD